MSFKFDKTQFERIYSILISDPVKMLSTPNLVLEDRQELVFVVGYGGT